MSTDDKIFADGMSFNRKESDYLIPLNASDKQFVLRKNQFKSG